MARKTIAQILEEQRLIAVNIRKPEIISLLEGFGYDCSDIDKGEALYNEISQLSEKQTKEQQEKNLAYDMYFEAKNECEIKQENTFKIVKMVSRHDKNLQERLKIHLHKKNTVSDWIEQIIEFYNLVLNEPDFLNSLKKFGVGQEKLIAEKQDFKFLKTLRNEAMAEKGQAQEATRLRNEKMEELKDYCYELKTIAEIALEKQPQLLEELGILVRS